MTRLFLPAAAWTAATLLSAGVAAAPSAADVTFQQDRAACMRGSSHQDRTTCMKEARAALQEARRGQLGNRDAVAMEQNRIARCNGLPAADRENCNLRMLQGTTSGTAREGGILRESTQVVPAR